MPLVSIGLPVYNGQNYLRKSIESVLCQTFQDFELIISDNASTDTTKNICMEYLQYDSRVKYFRNQENIGYAGNYNKVLSLSNGIYFKWIAHDDIINKLFLEKCIAVFSKFHNIIAVFPGLSYIDENNNIIESCNKTFDIMQDDTVKRLRELVNHEIGGTDVYWAIYGLINRNMLNKSSLHGTYIAADRVLLMELVLLGKIKYISDNMLYIRKHSGTTNLRKALPREKYSWCNSKYVPKYVLPNWNLYHKYYNTALRYKLGIIPSINAFYEITRKMYKNDLWNLAGEIKLAIKEFVGDKTKDYDYHGGN